MIVILIGLFLRLRSSCVRLVRLTRHATGWCGAGEALSWLPQLLHTAGLLERPTKFIRLSQVLFPVGIILGHHSSKDHHSRLFNTHPEKPVIHHDAPHALGNAHFFKMFRSVTGRTDDDGLLDFDPRLSLLSFIVEIGISIREYPVKPTL